MLTSWTPERGGDVLVAPPKASLHGDEDIATPITNGEATSPSPWLRPVRGDEDMDHDALIRTLRAGARAADEKFDDAGTNDFLVGLMAAHEKTAWMLRASAV